MAERAKSGAKINGAAPSAIPTGTAFASAATEAFGGLGRAGALAAGAFLGSGLGLTALGADAGADAGLGVTIFDWKGSGLAFTFLGSGVSNFALTEPVDDG